jgi:membrane-associated phospholipid phosphatase
MIANARIRPPGQPVDRLLAAYAIAGGAALLFPHRTPSWPWLLLLHAIAILFGFGLAPVRRAWNAVGRLAARPAELLHDWYPVLLIPFLYAELPPLNLAVWNGRYFDPVIIAIEQFVFHGQPSRDWAAAMPVLPLSEMLHAGYLSYYFIIFAPPLFIFLSATREEFRRAVFALMLTFVVHYLFFIWLPVQGPRYLFPAPDGEISRGPVYRLTHVILEAGSSRGAAFPSSHVGVAVAQTITAWRYYRRLVPILALLTIGLACGAVYGGFHYATDALAGAALGGAASLVAPLLYRRVAAPGPASPDAARVGESD